MRRILLYFSIKYQGDFKSIYKAIIEKEAVSEEKLIDIEKQINCNYITVLDKEYPSSLKAIGTPPFVLFYYGDIDLLKEHKIAIIGKRENSEYGKLMTKKIVKELKSYNNVIVSGLALGVDSIAHNEALENNMKTIAILGGGIDYCYPYSNKDIYNNIKEKGLILSEYPNKIVPKPHNFLIRNRIIAALSDVIVVTEASFKSGTMNTVAYGLEFGKEICCIPYLANENSGCNKLIKQGAKLIENASDIYE